MTQGRINIVTAVSRQHNLPRIHRSIEAAKAKSKLQVKWILVIDASDSIWPENELAIRAGSIEVEKVVYDGGRHVYGIPQKNAGMDRIKDGYYHCMDDDNLVHPDFFVGLEEAMESADPEARAFVVGQQRWDGVGNLYASSEYMGYGQIDNTMFVVHIDLIGEQRYDPAFAGREDFVFFRSLWEQNVRKFVFVKKILAYYNYLRIHPVESPWEPNRLMAAAAVPSHPAQVITQEKRTPGVMKIAFYSSKRDRCGISTYTSHLMNALRILGHEVEYFSSSVIPRDPEFDRALQWKPDVFHFQHETSIMPPAHDMERYSTLLRNSGVKGFITLHTESQENVRIGRTVGRIIVHRPSPFATDAVVLPMPCTAVSVLPDRADARRRFGIPNSAFLLSTIGFMIPWKEHPRILQLLVPWLRERTDVHVQIISSEHFNEDLRAYGALCRQQIASVAAAAALSDRVHHIDSYPDDLEVINRLSMSNLGYVWCPFDTGSSSAAGAQFTTAKCPLVATTSTHYSTLGEGAVYARKESMGEFVQLIQDTAGNPGLLDVLRSNQDAVYAARNYLETAKKHVAIYKGEL